MIQDIAPMQLHLDYSQKQPRDGDTVFVFRGSTKREDRALVHMDPEHQPHIPSYKELSDAGYITEAAPVQFLFSIDDKDYFLLNNGGKDDVQLPGYEYTPIRTFCDRTVLPGLPLAGLTAYHLFFWYRDNTCCGRCGHRMIPFETERAVICPECKNLVFPKLMPAVIIGVRNGNKILCSRYAGREYKGVALLAGFCEIGESLEQTVAREVEEEVNCRVKNITYFGSQPWGLDSNLLAGFFCDLADDDSITIDEHELASAGWVDRSELEPMPNVMSLTATMIEAFRKGDV
ncbi:MAG: NAD(+) diphosphatase [Lachnospiraceae bacterium]|nr:NAD(+) diphosphatase [Lachnospiraceae bacterium]